MTPERLAWEERPLRDRPWRGLFALSVLLLTEFACLAVWESAALALVALVAVGGAIAPFFLTTRYELDDAGARSRLLGQEQARAWREIRRVEPDARGVLLSPFARRHLLDGPRGLYLRSSDLAVRDAAAAFARARVAG